MVLSAALLCATLKPDCELCCVATPFLLNVLNPATSNCKSPFASCVLGSFGFGAGTDFVLPPIATNEAPASERIGLLLVLDWPAKLAVIGINNFGRSRTAARNAASGR